MTVAAVGIAIETIDDSVPESQLKRFHELLVKELSGSHPVAVEMLEHLTEFVGKMSQSHMPRTAAVGAWVVSNLKGEAPTEVEHDISPDIGQYLETALLGWWDRLV